VERRPRWGQACIGFLQNGRKFRIVTRSKGDDEGLSAVGAVPCLGGLALPLLADDALWLAYVNVRFLRCPLAIESITNPASREYG
jgi:hypothetical protein